MVDIKSNIFYAIKYYLRKTETILIAIENLKEVQILAMFELFANDLKLNSEKFKLWNLKSARIHKKHN